MQQKALKDSTNESAPIGDTADNCSLFSKEQRLSAKITTLADAFRARMESEINNGGDLRDKIYAYRSTFFLWPLSHAVKECRDTYSSEEMEAAICSLFDSWGYGKTLQRWWLSGSYFISEGELKRNRDMNGAQDQDIEAKPSSSQNGLSFTDTFSSANALNGILLIERWEDVTEEQLKEQRQLAENNPNKRIILSFAIDFALGVEKEFKNPSHRLINNFSHPDNHLFIPPFEDTLKKFKDITKEQVEEAIDWLMDYWGQQTILLPWWNHPGKKIMEEYFSKQ